MLAGSLGGLGPLPCVASHSQLPDNGGPAGHSPPLWGIVRHTHGRAGTPPCRTNVLWQPRHKCIEGLHPEPPVRASLKRNPPGSSRGHPGVTNAFERIISLLMVQFIGGEKWKKCQAFGEMRDCVSTLIFPSNGKILVANLRQKSGGILSHRVHILKITMHPRVLCTSQESV